MLPNVPWSLFLQTGFPIHLWEEKYISVSEMHTSQGRSSEIFLQYLSKDISDFTGSLKSLRSIP